MAYSFVMSYAILQVMKLLPWLKLRVDGTVESKGLDESEIGQSVFDFVSEKVVIQGRPA
jgi:ammonia channel protein AmtB